MITTEEKLARVRELESSTRKLLGAANVGGIGISLVLAAWLVVHGVSLPWWAIFVIGAFSLGVSFVVGAYLHSVRQYRKETDKETTGFGWNATALVCLVLGSLLGAFVLDRVHAGKPAESDAAPAADAEPATEKRPTQLAAIIDAGSSGSRLWIFEWSQEANGDPVVAQKLRLEDKDVTGKDECPLTNIIEPGNATCECLKKLLTQGYQTVASNGGSAPAALPLWVKATGGVRKQSMQDQVGILTKTQECLHSAEHYSWRSAEAIAGHNEALYAWLAINYQRKSLRADSVGIVEIGGQSAQFAFKVGKAIAPTQRGAVLTVPLKSGDLYVYGLSDALGKNAGIEGLGGRPAKDLPVRDCGLTNDYRKCLLKIDEFICSKPYGNAPCPHRSSEFPPPGDIQFIGLSNFMHIMSNIDLDKPLLSAARERAEKMCGSEPGKDELRKQWIKVKGKFEKDVCLDALYTSQVAQYAWGLPLTAITPASNTDPEWPLGAMFMEVAQHSRRPSL